jgi:hypothetical protein
VTEVVNRVVLEQVAIVQLDTVLQLVLDFNIDLMRLALFLLQTALHFLVSIKYFQK